MKVKQLIKELKKYPPNANARAYEGEVCGIIIESKKDFFSDDYEYLGCIEAHESENVRFIRSRGKD